MGVVIFPPLLNENAPSRFNTSTLISDIVKEGMVEKMNTSISYSSFIAACNPAYCSYTITEQRSIVALLTTVLGVFSGLNVAMQLIVPLVMKFVYQCYHGVQSMYLLVKSRFMT